MASTSTPLTFPHPVLTPINGEPTSSSLSLLQKELYANARQIYSTRGGGNHGHLRIMLTDVAYITRTNAIFIIPVHPGVAPIHAAGATAPQIAENIRLFNQSIGEQLLYQRVTAALKQQLILAVENRYMQVLEDTEFGFSDVTPLAILTHLKATYGVITQDDLETNRNLLVAQWNPDDPIENIWLRIRECQSFCSTIEPITNGTAIRLTLQVFEGTGVFASAVDKWRDKPLADHTLLNFTSHFNFENKERLRKLTAQTAGYHGANQATIVPASPAASVAAAAALVANAAPAALIGDVRMFYCHTHGLGKNSAHTSATCTHPGSDHKTGATILNMMGGNNKISTGRPRTPRFNG